MRRRRLGSLTRAATVRLGGAAAAAVVFAGASGAQQPAHADSSAHALPAYRYRVLGAYDEQTGEPIEGVEVLDVLNGNSALTTTTGTVSLVFLPDGGSLVRVRKLGYGVQTFTVPISPLDTAPLTVVMARAQTLAKVVVKDSMTQHLSPNLRAFEERRKAGFGHFIDEAEMRKSDGRTMANVLISHLPGLMVAPAALGAEYIVSTRKMCRGLALAQCRVPNCYPTVLVDGVPANLGLSANAPPDWSKISPTEYAAVEFYQGAETPAEFGNNECGVLLLWSRER